MLIWFRRLWPIALAACLMIGIYLIFPPFGNDRGDLAGDGQRPDGLSAFIEHPEPKPLPDLQFTDATGQAVKLSDFRGKIVLLNLWATWCAPCRKEMPDLARLEEALGGADFTVVAVSIDRKGIEASGQFLKEVGADRLDLYLDASARILNAVKGPGLPTTLLIDRQGREQGRLIGPADWSAPEAQLLVQKAIAR